MEPIVLAVIGLVGTVSGGVLLEIVRKGLTRAKDKADTATELRQEIRQDLNACKTELTDLRKEIRELEREVDEWRERYYALQQEHSRCSVCHLPDSNHTQD